MEAEEYYNILFEAETMTAASSEVKKKEGSANNFVYYDANKRKIVNNGSGWVDAETGANAGDPKYLRIEKGNGWELGSTIMAITGSIHDKSDAVINILHTGMPISMPMSDSILNDVIAKIENGRAKRGSANAGIEWMADDDGKNITMYAKDAGALRSLKKGFTDYKKKHGLELELANLNSLIKNMQSMQKRINQVCNTEPSMSVEYAHALGDSISLCRKGNEFIQGLRSSTKASNEMNTLLLNNKIIANMADEKSNKDSFPNMLKRLMVLRKRMLEHFSTDEINESNQGKYRDILTSLIDTKNQNDPDFARAEAEFTNKLAGIGMNPEIAMNKLCDELFQKYKKFQETPFETEEECEATAQALLLEAGRMYNLNLIPETWYKSYVNAINNTLAIQMEALRKGRELEGLKEAPEALPGDVEATSPAAASGTDSVPSYSYYFLYDVKFQLKFDTPVAISLKEPDKKKAWHSVLSRLGKAGWECLGYRPQGYINNIINSYATTRDCRVMVPAAMLKGSAALINAIGKKALGRDTWFSPDNKNRFQISKWLREEVQTKAGEINPEIKKIESGLVNAPRSLANGWRQLWGKKTLEKPVAHIDTTNFDGSNIAPDRIKYAEAPENMRGKSGHYKMKTDEKNKGKLTNECADGGAVMAGSTTSGDGFFQMPGSISSEGNPIAPTYTQTPFVKGEKTSTADSGSGDKFAGSSINKDKKKKKDDEWFERIQSIPDVNAFFKDWGK